MINVENKPRKVQNNYQDPQLHRIIEVWGATVKRK